jgi:hypothetical protein
MTTYIVARDYEDGRRLTRFVTKKNSGSTGIGLHGIEDMHNGVLSCVLVARRGAVA